MGGGTARRKVATATSPEGFATAAMGDTITTMALDIAIMEISEILATVRTNTAGLTSLRTLPVPLALRAPLAVARTARRGDSKTSTGREAARIAMLGIFRARWVCSKRAMALAIAKRANRAKEGSIG